MTSIATFWYNYAGIHGQTRLHKDTGSPNTNIAENVSRLRGRIACAAQSAGRTPESVRLVGVSKTMPAASVLEAFAAGIGDIGENYIQEAVKKIPGVLDDLQSRDEPNKPTWHFIGYLQRNKAKFAVQYFDLIQTVDSLALAQTIGRQAEMQNKTQAILLEVKLGEGEVEDTRAGIAPNALPVLVEQIAHIGNVQVRGLMAVAPFGTNNETARPFFAQMRTLWETLPPENRHELSMGMSGDFEAAIAEGATLIRIGTALFGQRAAKPD